MSPATSDSDVVKNTRVPSAEDPRKPASKFPFLRCSRSRCSEVVPPERWYTSRAVSVSAPDIGSLVVKNTRVPSSDMSSNLAEKPPLPPGPIATRLVTPFSYW